MKTKERGETCSAHINLVRAIKGLEAAANNLSWVSEKSGDDKCRAASALLSQIRHALEYGSCYPTEGHAAAFDQAVENDTSRK